MVTDRLSCLYRAALAPVCAQPAGEPREGVLQQFPWIYRVSALEVLRQVRLEASPLPSSTAPADLRSYLYLALVRAFFLDEGYRPRPSLAAPAVCRLSAVEPQRVIWTRAGM